MKAAQINAYGDASQLFVAELPKPTVAADEVLVETYATSINPIDWKAREGMMQKMFPWKFPVVLGWDVAGVITEVGADVKTFKVGDEVFARPDIYQDGTRGSYAEYVAVRENQLAYKPANIDFKQAAAVPLAGMTALQILRKLEVGPGKKVLIQAGGVGIFAIQLAKLMGAYVATTASAHNAEFVKGLGADEVIDYHTTKITDVLHDYDAVYDMVSAIDEGIAILKPTGKLITISGYPTPEQQAGPQTVESGYLAATGEDLAYLADLIRADKLQIVLDEEFPLTTEGIQAAHRRSEGHHAKGKIVVRVR
ncbi:NADP-dependent oxidoreductase [Periweissella ghanensis]|uniref:L-threonine 3-dehydrogenase n=1 Tax=Periweissella ghanensis TaxID=467997 RepID=A0ABM8ZD71_9LACO|nr:NADP-dependent oxidoreductase [Periweissella ghanensis]MCM0601851.1 NADP-dependent oxidoreductase [Periweissella ghanensis]CAH0418838.1 L-threonine 3-dehydrogenase [Periweissella ghanensis]